MQSDRPISDRSLVRFQVRQPESMQGVAQLEECRRRKPEAAGSYPATLTNNDGDCGVVVCIARCERAGSGSKPGDRPKQSVIPVVVEQQTRRSQKPMRQTRAGATPANGTKPLGIAQERSIALQAARAGSVTRVLHQHCRREGWRPQRSHKPHSLGSIPRPATNPLNWSRRGSI